MGNIGYVKGNGTTTKFTNYKFEHYLKLEDVSYFRLKQVDYDGNYEYSTIISITNYKNKMDRNLVRTIDILGRDIDTDYNGIKILIYDDGTIEKKY